MSKIITVWVVSELYYPEETSTGHFMTKIAEGLAKEYSVRVLCAQPSYSRRGTRVPAHETHNGVDIWRCPSTTLNKDIFIFRLVNLVTISISIFVAALTQFHEGDCVLVVTNPPLLPYVTMLACRLRHAKCIIRVDDVYPDILTATGMVKNKSISFRILDYLTRKLYSYADWIVVLGRDVVRLISRKIPRHQKRIRMITNWADLDLVSPATKRDNVLLNELGLTDKFIVQWAGNMGHPHEVKSLFEAMIQLKNNPNIHFIFIGSGYKRVWLESQVKQSGLKNATFLGNKPRSEQANFLNACDIAVSSLIPGMSGISVPSRVYNILAAGKPILAIGEADSEISYLIAEEKVGWIVPPGQPDQIVSAILEASVKPTELSEMGKRGRAVVETKYSSESIIKNYVDLIKDFRGIHLMQNGICLITGANGFLGSEIVRQALAAQLAVRATDKHAESMTPGVDYRPADILEVASLNSLFRDVTLVIHAAGLAHIFNKTQAIKAQFKAINEQGTVNICQAAAKAGVRHFILISSVSVYGLTTQGMCDENAPCFPEGPYAQSKYQAEQRAIEIARQSGMALTILRLATLYGENDPGNVARLMRTIDRRRFIWIGDGSNLKSLLYRGDAARACVAVACSPSSGIRIYNVSAQPCPMRTLVEGLAAALGRPIPQVHIPPALVLPPARMLSRLAGDRGRLGDLFTTIEKWIADDAYDASHFQQTFGYNTGMELTEGLQREVAWYRSQTHSRSS